MLVRPKLHLQYLATIYTHVTTPTYPLRYINTIHPTTYSLITSTNSNFLAPCRNNYATNLWAASEGVWVGCFSFLAVIMITVMGLAMLRTNQMQEKWKVKLAKAMDDENERGLGNRSRKYALFLLPLITVLREGLEAVVFIGGVSAFVSSTSFSYLFFPI